MKIMCFLLWYVWILLGLITTPNNVVITNYHLSYLLLLIAVIITIIKIKVMKTMVPRVRIKSRENWCSCQNALDFLLPSKEWVLCSLFQIKKKKKMSNETKAGREETHEIFRWKVENSWVLTFGCRQRSAIWQEGEGGDAEFREEGSRRCPQHACACLDRLVSPNSRH